MKGSNAPQARPTSTEKTRSPRDPVAPGTTPDKPTTPVSHMNRKPVISSISEQGRGDQRSLERKPLQNHLFSRDWFRSDREQVLQHRRKVATFLENCCQLEGKSWIFERIPRSNSNTRETDDFSSEIKAKSCFPHRIGRFAGDLTLQNWPASKENHGNIVESGAKWSKIVEFQWEIVTFHRPRQDPSESAGGHLKVSARFRRRLLFCF